MVIPPELVYRCPFSIIAPRFGNVLLKVIGSLRDSFETRDCQPDEPRASVRSLTTPRCLVDLFEPLILADTNRSLKRVPNLPSIPGRPVVAMLPVVFLCVLQEGLLVKADLDLGVLVVSFDTL